jgi:glycerophosphoryl diester phosphodiesterase
MGVVQFAQAQPWLDKQGHRGCRGLMPENTIPAMKKALDLGVNTLEMNIVFSADKQPVISSDPYMSSVITRTPEGKNISAAKEKSYNLYQLPYSEIKKFDVGSKPNPNFPKQQKMVVSKPLLSDLIDSVETYVSNKGISAPYYNIEIKASSGNDNAFYPSPLESVHLLMEVLNKKNIPYRCTIQSYDPRVLEIVHKEYPTVSTAFLVNNDNSLEENLASLTFKPLIYSPQYEMVTRSMVKQCQKMGIRVIPWTVNSKEDIDKLLRMGVNGIITDYPDLFSKN